MSPERMWEILDSVYGDAEPISISTSEISYLAERKLLAWAHGPHDGGGASYSRTAQGREEWKRLVEERVAQA